MNTDQGSQSTSSDFIGVLDREGIRISMDGKGCWRDNVFVERLWKTIKYEHVYLHAYETVSEARTKITTYLDFYNRRRPHSRFTAARRMPCTSIRCPCNGQPNSQSYPLENPGIPSDCVGPPLLRKGFTNSAAMMLGSRP